MILPLPAYRQLLFVNLLLCLIGSSSFAQTYCTPKYNFVDCNTLQRRVYIYNVTLNNRTYSSSCSQAGYAGLVNNVNDPIVLTSGYAYNMTVNTSDYDSRTYSSYYNQSNYAVWIDYDNNGIFDNYELIKNGNSSTFTLYSYSSAAGNYRMRIRVRPNTAIDDPCIAHDYGETEDYIVRIIPVAPAINISQYQYPCANASFTLSATGCPYGTIQWRDQNDTFIGNNPVSVQTAQNKTYYATCVVNGTASSPSSKVYVYPTIISPPAISSNNYNLTVGQSAALTSTGCTGTVTWSNGQTGTQLTVAPTQTTTYSATCSAYYYPYCTSAKSNEITVTVNAPNAPSILASKNIVCPNESVTLSASNCSGIIKWSTGASGASISVAPTQKTDYLASCVINGIEGAKATTTVSVNPSTAIVSQPNQVAVCEAGQASFGVSATGSGNLSYSWTRNGQPLSDSSATTAQLLLRNVTPANNGMYQVKVTGACGTVNSNAVSLQVSPKMTASNSTQAATCSGDANGVVIVSVSGGLDNKQYRLTPQNDYQSSATFTNLRAGSYAIQVRDQVGCTTETLAEIKQPDRITFTVKAPVNAKCAGGSDGAVNVEATGGNGNFNYSISGGASQASGQFLNLKANTTYTLKATDAKGCSETTNAYVGAPNQIIVSLTPSPVLCNGESSGKINTTASGGSGTNYQYQLGQNTPQANSSFSNLKAGVYTVTVRDANGCEGKADATVNEPVSLSLSATATLVSCISDSSASITAAAVGGTGPYQYQLGSRSFQSTNLFTGIREGSFVITGKDANGCTANTTVSVKKAEPLLLQATPQAASCCTCPNGSVALLSSGGIGLKQFQVGQSGVQQSSAFKGLAPGQYPVIVRDETGCTTSLTVTITNATAATLALVNVKNVNCSGGHDGAATVQVTGGGVGLMYAWKTKNPSDSLGASATVTRLPEGEFTVTVTDSNRCTSVKSGTLVAQNPLPPKPTITQSGGNLVSSAQSGVQWFSGPDLKTGKPVIGATQATFTPYQSSPYFVVVTLNGCASLPSDIFSFILTALDPLMPISIRVIPNPISDRLRVEIDQQIRSSVHIRLSDLTGRTVLDVQTPVFVGKNQFEWPVQQGNKGVYLLQAEADVRHATERVIIH